MDILNETKTHFRYEEDSMRVLFCMIVCTVSLWGQGAGLVQFRDWGAHPPGPKPKISCGQLRSLTSYELSVVSATMVPASAAAPEHCRSPFWLHRKSTLK
jgi:hypothetical protein